MRGSSCRNFDSQNSEMAAHMRFNDSDEAYQPSDSDVELSDKEKELLNKFRDRKPSFSESEDEVYGVNETSEDEQSDIALSDVEGQGEDDDKDGIPDAKAWGKNKRSYYATDYVDPDYGGFQGRDANLAEMEEEAARNLQEELAKSMDDDDFNLDSFGKPEKATEEGPSVEKKEEVIKVNPKRMTKQEQLDILRREAPEFYILIMDYGYKMEQVHDYLQPCIILNDEGKIEECTAMVFVRKYRELIFNYCSNMYMYFLVKGSRENVESHPVVKRLYQFRKLFMQMDPIFEDIMKPQIIDLLAQHPVVWTPQELKKKRKATLNLLSGLNKQSDKPDKKKKNAHLHIDKKLKSGLAVENATVDEELQHQLENANIGSSSDEMEDEKEENLESGKRAITYQIAKNKGLMPHRKKEQRNPRVKHRNKFRKAKIRRKGAIREVRREMSRYGGELSGIKATVSKSIKIKT